MSAFKPLLLGLAGAAIAGIPGLGITAFTGFSIGMTLGGLLFPENLGTQQRGKLNEIRIQGASQGTPIPKIFGVDRVGGNIIWTSSIKETVTTTKTGGSSGGAPTYTTQDYHYATDLAVLVCEGIVSYRRIWLNTNVVYDDRGGSPIWSFAAVDNTAVYLYTGTTTQLANSVMQAAVGVNSCPAYRGFAYTVFHNLNLDPYGGNVPNVTFEVDGGSDDCQSLSNWVCESNGLDSSDYDFSAVSAITFRGFSLPAQTPGRNILDALSQIFNYDNIEVDGKMKASIRSGTALATLSEAKMGGALGTKPDGETVNMLRIQESELPVQLTVTYNSEAGDFQVWSQQDQIQTVFSSNLVTLDLPFVLSDDLARRVAVTQLYLTFIERNQFTIKSDWSALVYSPGDVINIPTSLGVKLARIINMSMMLFGPVTLVLVPEEPSIYTQTITGAIPFGSSASVNSGTTPLAALTDLNAVIDSDADHVGFYGGAASADVSWPGGGFFIDSPGIVGESGRLYSNTSGVDFPIISLSSSCMMGTCDTTLPDGPCATWDIVSTVTVTMIRGQLFSAADADVLNGANMIVIGQEILQFATATLVGTNQYTLSRLIRGRRGTEYATSSHFSSEPMTAVTNKEGRFNTKFNQRISTTFAGVFDWVFLINNYNYGTLPASTAVTLFGRSRMPYSPCHLSQSYQNGISTIGYIDLAWIRRARKNGDLQDNIDVPLDEVAEHYQIEIYQDSSYAVLLHMYDSIGGPTIRYSAADQASHFGTGFTGVGGWIVYQYSDEFGGRGFAAKGTMTVKT